jgi:putative transcriptional regulator
VIATIHGTQPVLTNRLSRLMGDRRLSIQDVARATGLSYTTVFQLYHDRSTRYDRDTLDRLCTYFGVGIEQILEWTPTAPEQTEG